MFEVSTHAHWVSNVCHWFDEAVTDSYSGYREITLLPGTEALTATLKLKQNPSVDCKNFNFFDKFANIQVEFIVDSSDQTYIID